MDRAGRRLTGSIKAATGERIVAFGRVGKPPENPFFQLFSQPAAGCRAAAKTPVSRNGFLSRVA